MPLPVFIGYDRREAIAFDVCRFSLLRHASIPLHVQALRQDELRARGLYRRQALLRDGQRVDAVDGRPFSTEFSFTRFLVPALCGYDGWALFVDCDFLFLADVAELPACADDGKAAMVCRQIHVPAENTKMDAQVQTTYRRKNWSSLMLLNCGHPAVKALTVDAVNERPGSWLHGFDWLDDADIGDLPHAWNWIAGVTSGAPRAVHYTAGGPWFPAYTETAYAREWRDAYAQACAAARGASSGTARGLEHAA